MTYADYRKSETEVHARFAQASPRLFIVVEAVRFGAYLALAMTLFDLLPASLSFEAESPLKRVALIAAPAIALAFWYRGHVVRTRAAASGAHAA
jgi:hypothetical protein